MPCGRRCAAATQQRGAYSTRRPDRAPAHLSSPPLSPCRADLASRLRSTGIPLRAAKGAKQQQQPAEAATAEPTYPELSTPLPFHVHRSRMGNLPVYHDARIGGSKKVTILRKYAGDVASLGRAVEAVCASPVTMFHGRIEVKGHHGERVKTWLASLGF